MMIVMPAFAATEHGQNKAVPAPVTGIIADTADDMRQRIDEERTMIEHRGGDEEAPDQTGDSPERVHQDCIQHRRNGVKLIQQTQLGILRQIPHNGQIGLHVLVGQQPPDMRIPEPPLQRRMAVLHPIRVLMMMPMMGGGMMGSSGLPNGTPFDILRLMIGEKGADVNPLPSQLSTIERHAVNDAVNGNNPRSFRLAMQGMVHTINNRLFEMDAVAQDEIVRLNDLEVWEFVNLEGSGGGMGMGMMNMEMPHPMHIHGVQFQVLERQIARGFESAYQELSGGFVDEGWKDTVLVMPGETVRVLVRFENYTGIYLYHCHNLEHEDAGMMRNYRIKG